VQFAEAASAAAAAAALDGAIFQGRLLHVLPARAPPARAAAQARSPSPRPRDAQCR
jgi:RNA recognition motif-containing protein